MPENANLSAKRAGRLEIPPARALGLLSELRDRLADSVATAYAQNLKSAKNDLLQLAQRASDPARVELYQSGHALLTNSGLGLLQRFRSVYTNDCDQAIASLNGTLADAWDSAEELALVDTNEFERELAVGRLSAKATYSCSQQLTALDRRVALLLGLKRMESDSNPFAIKRLFTAFVKAAEANWAGEQLSLILLETFEHYTAEDLPNVYRDLNQYLVDQGVLEKLPVELEDRDRELHTPERLGDAADGVGDIFVQLASGLTGPSRSGGGHRGLGAGTYDLGGSAAGGPAGLGAGGMAAGGQMGPMVFGQFIEGLTGLQRGSGHAAAKLGLTLGDFDPTSSDMLRSLGSSPLLRWLQPNDAMTIDLIAMLFDCIFSDPEVSEALRQELGKLQVPILKVALLNKSFFSDQRHPARRLMDLIATAVRGWNKEDETQLLEVIRAAVESVVEGFDHDTSVFGAQAEKLEQILRDADRRARENVSELVRRVEQRDRKIAADTVVKDQIARILAGQTLPPAVRNFVDDTWCELLTRIYVKQGEKSEAWQQALATLEDLAWSVKPKSVPAERHRLMGMLPVLLRRLPEGMAMIGRADAWDEFLKELMQLHMDAIKPRSASDAAVETVAPDRGERDAGFGRRDERGNARAGADAVIATATPKEAIPEEEEASDEFTEAARGIEVGDWVEFANIDGSSITLRASWLSRMNGLILFADRQGQNPEILTLPRLARHLRHANARILSRDPLTDRAVAKLLVGASSKADVPA